MRLFSLSQGAATQAVAGAGAPGCVAGKDRKGSGKVKTYTLALYYMLDGLSLSRNLNLSVVDT